MGPYIPAIVWLIGIAICAWILNRRNVKSSFSWNLLITFLGPLAIPLVFLAKPEDNKKPTAMK